MAKEFLDLGRQPIANGFLTPEQIPDEYFYDLKVGLDEETLLVTLMNKVDPPRMFNDNYSYRSSMSQTMRNHFKKFAEDELTRISPNREDTSVLEIGSNDGAFIRNLEGYKDVISVEPCGNFAKELREDGFIVYQRFWTEELARELRDNHGTFNIIYSANCMCHIPDLDDAFAGIKHILDKDGIFVFEDPSLASMILRGSYDQIYDEHAHVFSVTSLVSLAERHGLRVYSAVPLSVHGGSNRIMVSHSGYEMSDWIPANLFMEDQIGLKHWSTYELFAERVKKSKEDLLRTMTRIKSDHKNILSYGATSKSTTVFNYCGIDSRYIDYIVDTTPEKQGKLSPGVHIPIISPDSIDILPSYAFLGAWNFTDEIIEKEKGRDLKWITHVPFVRVL